MDARDLSRRALLRGGGGALAGLAGLRIADLAAAGPARPGEEVVPWLDPPPGAPPPEIAGQLLDWEALDSFITPTDRHFYVQHFGRPAIDPTTWRLVVDGLVQRPLALTLDDLRSRPRQEVVFALECSGNHGFPIFTGAVGNAVWAGTPLAPVLAEAGLLDWATEVVFWGADSGAAEVGGQPVAEQFARSLGRAEATDARLLLAYEMNGAPLPAAHGAPVRLIAPGRYGVANVKWLARVEALDTRYQGRFMAREYVTRREEQRGGQTLSRYTSVSRARLKSAPARVTRADGQYRIEGAAWGAPIARVEVRIDGGPWQAAALGEGAGAESAWALWWLDWGTPTAGEHAITSRAVDIFGAVQPAPDDPWLATKQTFWESNGQITRRVRI
jgi:DMSO/TMAO reductase YedYZ molybdopterin-dependent catalytic subunit